VFVSGPNEDERMWVASDDSNPVRRIAFGTETAAEAFAAVLPGWSVFPDTDQRWRPPVGRPPQEDDGPDER